MVRVRVVGPGGCGQTTLMRSLRNAGVKTNDIRDRDRKKHSPRPTGSEKKVLTVYVYGMPNLAIHSHIRRWKRGKQQRKLGKGPTKGFNRMRAIARRQRKGVDIFGVVDQFYAWRNHCNGPVLFVDFLSDVEASWKAIGKFIDKKLTGCPVFSKKRASKHEGRGITLIKTVYEPIYRDMRKSHLVVHGKK